MGGNRFVPEWLNAPYTPDATTWVKIKNPAHSRAKGRADFFEGREYRPGV
jgi:hypothetical protein